MAPTQKPTPRPVAPVKERAKGVLDAWERAGLPIWNQMPIESDRDFEWFTVYCQMGKGRNRERIEQLAAEERPDVTTLKRVSADHHWERRAMAYDRFMLGDHNQNAGLLHRLEEAASSGVDVADLVRHSWSYRRKDLRERKWVMGQVITDFVFNRMLASVGLRWDQERQVAVPSGEAAKPIAIEDRHIPAWAKLGMQFQTEAAYEDAPAQGEGATSGAADGDNEPVTLPENLADATDAQIDHAIAQVRRLPENGRPHTRQ